MAIDVQTLLLYLRHRAPIYKHTLKQTMLTNVWKKTRLPWRRRANCKLERVLFHPFWTKENTWIKELFHIFLKCLRKTRIFLYTVKNILC